MLDLGGGGGGGGGGCCRAGYSFLLLLFIVNYAVYYMDLDSNSDVLARGQK